ncbi:MAG: DegT/DnrJ/EryC1/StrS aminotransferase family protein, partial [Phycisphaeraceae bacterium]|nr:DegT/DnrJ/EryC1/StrS aminotransferase family protein [Phycisphaeraceae bacterium]
MTTTTGLAVLGGPKTVTESSPPWPYFADDEIEFVRQAMVEMRSDATLACTAWGGGWSEKLERRMADAMGRKFGIGACGGGPALHIACMAAGIEMGDEVITTPYSWGQTVACILQAGGVPVFADIDPCTL